jgi:hypothetical protein
MKRIHALLGFLLLLLLVIPGTNQEYINQAEFEDELDAQSEHVVSLHPYAFKPDSYYNMDRRWYITYYDIFLSSYETSPLSLYASVDLPHGKTIKKLTAYMHDFSSSGYVMFRLWRKRHLSSERAILGGCTTNTLPPSTTIYALKDTTIFQPVVANHNYSYYVEVYFSKGEEGNLAFYGAKIVLD